jgi:hypothetical protein
MNTMQRKIYKNHPPVPQALQEALKDYPELIAELQESLRGTGLTLFMSKSQRTDQFELALGSLEDGLGGFMTRAAKEVQAAEATGDAALIAKAKEKEMLMIGCRGGKLSRSVAELKTFFRWGED